MSAKRDAAHDMDKLENPSLLKIHRIVPLYPGEGAERTGRPCWSRRGPRGLLPTQSGAPVSMTSQQVLLVESNYLKHFKKEFGDKRRTVT